MLEQLQSPTIGKLAEALSKAQAEMEPAIKDSVNPFFKSHYADLASCIESAKKPLSKNGLSVSQTTAPIGSGLYVISTLMHTSGEWVRGVFPIAAKDGTPQAIGSATTYARRFAFSAIINQSASDDDAEGGTQRATHTQATQPKPSQPKPDVRLMPEGSDALTKSQLDMILFNKSQYMVPDAVFLKILMREAKVDKVERIPFDRVGSVLGAIQKLGQQAKGGAGAAAK